MIVGALALIALFGVATLNRAVEAQTEHAAQASTNQDEHTTGNNNNARRLLGALAQLGVSVQALEAASTKPTTGLGVGPFLRIGGARAMESSGGSASTGKTAAIALRTPSLNAYGPEGSGGVYQDHRGPGEDGIAGRQTAIPGVAGNM